MYQCNAGIRCSPKLTVGAVAKCHEVAVGATRADQRLLGVVQATSKVFLPVLDAVHTLLSAHHLRLLPKHLIARAHREQSNANGVAAFFAEIARTRIDRGINAKRHGRLVLAIHALTEHALFSAVHVNLSETAGFEQVFDLSRKTALLGFGYEISHGWSVLIIIIPR